MFEHLLSRLHHSILHYHPHQKGYKVNFQIKYSDKGESAEY